jgi:hypothetical protein
MRRGTAVVTKPVAAGSGQCSCTAGTQCAGQCRVAAGRTIAWKTLKGRDFTVRMMCGRCSIEKASMSRKPAQPVARAGKRTVSEGAEDGGKAGMATHGGSVRCASRTRSSSGEGADLHEQRRLHVSDSPSVLGA